MTILFTHPSEIIFDAFKYLFSLSFAELLNKPLLCIAIAFGVIAAALAVTRGENIGGDSARATRCAYRNEMLHRRVMSSKQRIQLPAAIGTAMIPILKTSLPIICAKTAWQSAFTSVVSRNIYAQHFGVALIPHSGCLPCLLSVIIGPSLVQCPMPFPVGEFPVTSVYLALFFMFLIVFAASLTNLFLIQEMVTFLMNRNTSLAIHRQSIRFLSVHVKKLSGWQKFLFAIVATFIPFRWWLNQPISFAPRELRNAILANRNTPIFSLVAFMIFRERFFNAAVTALFSRGIHRIHPCDNHRWGSSQAAMMSAFPVRCGRLLHGLILSQGGVLYQP